MNQLKQRMILFVEQSNIIRKKMESEISNLKNQVNECNKENEKLKTELKKLKNKKSRPNSSNPKKFIIKIRKSSIRPLKKRKSSILLEDPKISEFNGSFALQQNGKNVDFETEKKLRFTSKIYCETTENRKYTRSPIEMVQSPKKLENICIDQVFKIRKRKRSEENDFKEEKPFVEIYLNNGETSFGSKFLGAKKEKCQVLRKKIHIANCNKNPKKVFLLKLKRIRK